jgi:hypothetical protein
MRGLLRILNRPRDIREPVLSISFVSKITEGQNSWSVSAHRTEGEIYENYESDACDLLFCHTNLHRGGTTQKHLQPPLLPELMNVAISQYFSLAMCQKLTCMVVGCMGMPTTYFLSFDAGIFLHQQRNRPTPLLKFRRMLLASQMSIAYGNVRELLRPMDARWRPACL